MSSDETTRKVTVRRIKRRLKAAASIGLALLAGTFLACTPDKPPKEKIRAPVPPNPTTPSVGSLPAPSAQASAVASGTHAGTPATDPSSAASASASSSAIVKAKPPQSHPKAPTVDKHEHRKGMPVPDNLLE